MTEASKMTDQQLNRALAELMGYYLHETPGSHYLLMYPERVSASGICDDEETAWKQAPQYCTDPAASLEVQEAAIKHDYLDYCMALSEIIWPVIEDIVSPPSADDEYGYESIARFMTATPRQKAEAAYMTLKGE